MTRCLHKSGFDGVHMPDKWVFHVRELLEDFSLVSNRMNVAEARLFIHMNNIAVLPDVPRMTSLSDIRLFCKMKYVPPKYLVEMSLTNM